MCEQQTFPRVFSTFDKDQKIHRQYWKEHLKISKPAKFETDMSEVSKDIALQKSQNFTDVCMVGGTNFGTNLPPPYKRFKVRRTFLVFARDR